MKKTQKVKPVGWFSVHIATIKVTNFIILLIWFTLHVLLSTYLCHLGCSSNCEEFKDVPVNCYAGEHVTSKDQAKDEDLELNQECTLCYPEQIDMLDFIMNMVMFEEQPKVGKEQEQPVEQAVTATTKPVANSKSDKGKNKK